jgi:hypothetical protein
MFYFGLSPQSLLEAVRMAKTTDSKDLDKARDAQPASLPGSSPSESESDTTNASTCTSCAASQRTSSSASSTSDSTRPLWEDGFTLGPSIEDADDGSI